MRFRTALVIRDIRFLIIALQSWHDKDGPVAWGIFNARERLKELEPRGTIAERAHALAHRFLDLAQETIIDSRQQRSAKWVVAPTLPKVFSGIHENRGLQIAAGLFAMDVILADFSAGLIGSSCARKPAEGGLLLGNRPERSFRDQLKFLSAYLLAARDYFGASDAKDGIANLIAVALLEVKNCRRNLAWRLEKSFLPMVKEEVAELLGTMADDPKSGRAYFAPRLELLLRLLDEVKLNLRELTLEERTARR
jgi:hypothetical protein